MADLTIRLEPVDIVALGVSPEEMKRLRLLVSSYSSSDGYDRLGGKVSIRLLVSSRART